MTFSLDLVSNFPMGPISCTLCRANRVVRSVRHIFAVALAVQLAACSSTEHLTRAYELATVQTSVEEWRGYEVVVGQQLVLETSHYVSSLPFVIDGILGYRLNIQLEPKQIFKGQVIAIPSGQNKAYLQTLNAPSYKNVEVHGMVRVVELEETGISIEADLKSKEVPWKKNGIEAYRYARHSCLRKSDWACDFYTK